MVETSLPSLSMDTVLSEILPKLPTKSLARFKCVSKIFKATITALEFTKLLLRIPTVDRLLIFPNCFCITAYEFDVPAPLSAPPFFSWSEDYASYSIIGSCHGLLCIIRSSSTASPLVLLNPSTRICLDIHMPSLGNNKTNFGFGFDHGYKIVAISDVHDDRAVKTRETRVYSVSSNSWGTVHTTFPVVDSMLNNYNGVVINDHLIHWMFWSPRLRKHRIGCFDLCGEEWKDDVILPNYYYHFKAGRKVNLFDVGVVDGSLFSLFERKVEGDVAESHFYDVWVMEEYGVLDSWIKLLTIPYSEQLEGGVIPIAIRRRSGEVLIRHRRSTNFYWFNWAGDVVPVTAIPGALYFAESDRVYTCPKSLVSLPSGRAI